MVAHVTSSQAVADIADRSASQSQQIIY